MSRSLIRNWEDLTKSQHEGDRLTIFVHDEYTGKCKILDCHIYGVYREGDAEFDEEQERWQSAAPLARELVTELDGGNEQ